MEPLIWCTTLPISSSAFLPFWLIAKVAHARYVFFFTALMVFVLDDSRELKRQQSAAFSASSTAYSMLQCQRWARREIPANSAAMARHIWGLGLLVHAMSWQNVPQYREHTIWSVFFFHRSTIFLRNPMTCNVTQPWVKVQIASAFCAMFLSNKLFLLLYFLTRTKAAQTEQTALGRSGNCWGAEWCHIIKSAHYEKRTKHCTYTNAVYGTITA